MSRKNAFAIVNSPSAKDFKKNTDPSFSDATGGYPLSLYLKVEILH